MLLLLLLLLLRSGAFHRSRTTATGAAASATSPFAARCLLQFAGDRGLRLLLGRTRLLRTLPAAALLLPLLLLRLLLLRTFSVALLLLAGARSALVAALALPLARPAARAPLFLAAYLAGALLVLPDLLLHEPPRLLVEAEAQFIVTAVRAALPPFGVGLFAT